MGTRKVGRAHTGSGTCNLAFCSCFPRSPCCPTSPLALRNHCERPSFPNQKWAGGRENFSFYQWREKLPIFIPHQYTGNLTEEKLANLLLIRPKMYVPAQQTSLGQSRVISTWVPHISPDFCWRENILIGVENAASPPRDSLWGRAGRRSCGRNRLQPENAEPELHGSVAWRGWSPADPALPKCHRAVCRGCRRGLPSADEPAAVYAPAASPARASPARFPPGAGDGAHGCTLLSVEPTKPWWGGFLLPCTGAAGERLRHLPAAPHEWIISLLQIQIENHNIC